MRHTSCGPLIFTSARRRLPAVAFPPGGDTIGAAAMRVLILSASYGSGHNAAAHSLAGAFASAGASATVVDHFRDLGIRCSIARARAM